MTRTEIRASTCHHFLRRHSHPLFVLPAITYDAKTPLCPNCQSRAMETAAIMEGMESMFVRDESGGDMSMGGVDEGASGGIGGGSGGGSGSSAVQAQEWQSGGVYGDEDLYREQYPAGPVVQHRQHQAPQHQQQQHQHHDNFPYHQHQPQQYRTEDARLIDLIASLTLYPLPMSQPQTQPQSHNQYHTQFLYQPQTQPQLLQQHLWNPTWPAPPPPPPPPSAPTTSSLTSTPTTTTSSEHREMPYDIPFSTLSLVHRDPPTTFQDQTHGGDEAQGVGGVDAAERDARWRLFVQLRMCETGELEFEVEEKRTVEMMREVLARYA